MNFAISTIRSDFLVRARTAGLDDQGQQVQRLVAKGGEPCRDVLRRAKAGEQLILASYCPFANAGPFRELGPVFILGDETSERPTLSELPLRAGAGSKPYLQESFVVRAYNDSEEIVGAALATPESVNRELEAMFADAAVSFIHARFPTYGCYALRIDRG